MHARLFDAIMTSILFNPIIDNDMSQRSVRYDHRDATEMQWPVRLLGKTNWNISFIDIKWIICIVLIDGYSNSCAVPLIYWFYPIDLSSVDVVHLNETVV